MDHLLSREKFQRKTGVRKERPQAVRKLPFSFERPEMVFLHEKEGL